MQDFIKQNPVTAGGGVLLLLMVALNSGQIKQNQQFSAELKAERMEMSQKQALLSAQQQDVSAKAEIANARYESGCILVVSSGDPTKSAAIQQERPVLDGATGHPLSDGSVVCDPFGTTAIIMGQVASQIAYTGDMEVVKARIAEMGYDAKVVKPQQ